VLLPKLPNAPVVPEVVPPKVAGVPNPPLVPYRRPCA